MSQTVIVRDRGLCAYSTIFDEMKTFTSTRDAETPDEIWLLEHFPVYTQGQAGKAEHLLRSNTIPLVQSDRGGQITYHGPGQLVAYVLLDLHRRKMGIRDLVCSLEQTIINFLHTKEISATRREKAPGVYVDHAKIASLGLRVKQGCSYHGLALNVAMDLSPFNDINPCGFEKLSMTQIADFVDNCNFEVIKREFMSYLSFNLAYNPIACYKFK